MYDEEEDEMKMNTNFTLSESTSIEILKAPKRVAKNSKILSDVTMTREEKIKYASSILNSRK